MSSLIPVYVVNPWLTKSNTETDYADRLSLKQKLFCVCSIWSGKMKAQEKYCILVFHMERRRTGKVRNFHTNHTSKALVLPAYSSTLSEKLSLNKWRQIGFKFVAHLCTKLSFSFMKQDLRPCIWLVWLCKTAELDSTLSFIPVGLLWRRPLFSQLERKQHCKRNAKVAFLLCPCYFITSHF